MGYRAWMVNIELMRRGTEDNQAGKGSSQHNPKTGTCPPRCIAT
jgi:hypothetical protein